MENERIHDIFLSMMSNPMFKEFVKKNEDKTIEEIAMEYDIRILKEQNV